MSLLRQLLLSVTLAILIILVGTIFFSINSARQYLNTQLQSQSDSTATSLALTLSQPTNQDPTVRELLLSVLFDSGEFKLVEFLDPSGRIVVRLDMGAQADDGLQAPQWFDNVLPLAKHEAMREVSSGWSQLGVVRLQSNDTYARNILWQSTLKVVSLTIAAGVLWGIFVLILMGWLRRALHDDVMARVQAIADNKSDLELPPVRVPSILELREVSQIITQAHEKVQATASERQAKIESLQLALNQDEVTGLANRKYFVNELKRILNTKSTHPDVGHVMLFRQCDLQEINKSMSRPLVDQWLKNTGQLVLTLLRERIDAHAWLARLNGSDFAFVMPGVDGPQAMRLAKAVTDILLLQRVKLGNAGLCHWRMVLTDLQSGEDIAHVMGRLDEALMRAESAGHENVEFLPSENFTDNNTCGSGEQVWRDLLQNALENDWFYLNIDVYRSAVAPDGRASATIMLREPDSAEPLNGFTFMPAAARLGLSGACDIRSISLGLDWLRVNSGDLTVKVSLVSILQKEFNGELVSLLSSHPEQCARLIIEMDSYALVAHHEATLLLGNLLKDYKVRLGLRRFAEQAEAILYLHELPLEYIKISQNLLNVLDKSPGARNLLQAIDTTAAQFGIVVEV